MPAGYRNSRKFTDFTDKWTFFFSIREGSFFGGGDDLCCVSVHNDCDNLPCRGALDFDFNSLSILLGDDMPLFSDNNEKRSVKNTISEADPPLLRFHTTFCCW